VLPVGQPSGPDDERITSVDGALDHSVAVSTGLDAFVEGGQRVPEPTWLPFIVALGVAVFFVGMLVTATVVLVAGTVIGLAAVMAWAWHTEADLA
jgi:hypothetical protein